MALGAFLVSLIPYRVQKDEETGVVEIRSLLWACRKTPPKEGEEKGNYGSYCASMKKLADNLYSAKGHGEKYRILTEKVRAASELMQKTAGMSRKASVQIGDSPDQETACYGPRPCQPRTENIVFLNHTEGGIQESTLASESPFI